MNSYESQYRQGSRGGGRRCQRVALGPSRRWQAACSFCCNANTRHGSASNTTADGIGDLDPTVHATIGQIDCPSRRPGDRRGDPGPHRQSTRVDQPTRADVVRAYAVARPPCCVRDRPASAAVGPGDPVRRAEPLRGRDLRAGGGPGSGRSDGHTAVDARGGPAARPDYLGRRGALGPAPPARGRARGSGLRAVVVS